VAESPEDSVDDEDEFFWCPFSVPDLTGGVVLMERASGPREVEGELYIMSNAWMVVPPYLSPSSETYKMV
jgi:hypothetical protein